MIKTIYFGGGCFWCVESIYLKLKGVVDVKPGYMGGSTIKPTYEEVCEGNTNHVEVAKVVYNETIKLNDLSIENLSFFIILIYFEYSSTTSCSLTVKFI